MQVWEAGAALAGEEMDVRLQALFALDCDDAHVCEVRQGRVTGRIHQDVPEGVLQTRTHGGLPYVTTSHSNHDERFATYAIILKRSDFHCM